MKDARLTELNLLAGLDLAAGGNGEFGPVAGDVVLQDLYLHLILHRLVETTADYLGQGPHQPIDRVEYNLRFAFGQVVAGGHRVPVKLTHAGRIRIAQLRDELRLNRDREPFGILFNRTAFDRDLAVELPYASATAPVSLLFLDLDHFKSVNDTRGHQAGDEAMKAFFRLVVDLVGSTGEVFRYGVGDEVAAVLPASDDVAAGRLAEVIRQRVRSDLANHSGTNPLTVSVGSATFLKPTEPAAAIQVADQLVIRAKQAGRNRVESDVVK